MLKVLAAMVVAGAVGAGELPQVGTIGRAVNGSTMVYGDNAAMSVNPNTTESRTTAASVLRQLDWQNLAGWEPLAMTPDETTGYGWQIIGEFKGRRATRFEFAAYISRSDLQHEWVTATDSLAAGGAYALATSMLDGKVPPTPGLKEINQTGEMAFLQVLSDKGWSVVGFGIFDDRRVYYVKRKAK